LLAIFKESEEEKKATASEYTPAIDKIINVKNARALVLMVSSHQYFYW
jgi:hypothetical protein